ncbi:regulator of protease activity HflC (stomatin/prohibitin superfamily) [Streptosporangium becharense]|uniref:Regulator of protease activity HflC (Stomatin/prohibitin superfamily) n=1 Tax=Streptosporangium becharense TaxID=1816182 RepID=A0A7W9ICK7_9ACTN|nr:SPFH domain-containing protein [Streptosporangium becharense]MBB2912951.1 regulator of protease activity HflC (stomatin/prohibitin superfamily) [Streptosporangium becharense]MBB5818224.1 regulator of protease activity HflC (stomatin/prohibitin superfamily) [Streptosporangium becharense]
MSREFSKIKESLASWSEIRQLLRGGESGQLVPVVIPKDRRGFAWVTMLLLALYLAGTAVFAGGALALLAAVAAVFSLVVGLVWMWRRAIIEIEEGTTGVRSRWGAIVGTLPPGRHYLWLPWDRVDAVVDTSTEIPYSAPIAACPTAENVPLKSIEFFLKFRIVDPVAFVRTIGAGNFDLVLSSAVQDAIRQRSRLVHTERAYDLRGSDVGDMQELLTRQLGRYGVRITGANIPDVQLPDQYQQHLATREKVAKELSAFEREWELTRKRRIDTLLMEIERAKKTRDARIVEVRAAANTARKDVARMLEEHETEAQRVRWEIEAKGRAELTAAENEAKGLRRLADSYRDNRAVLQYELARRRLDVGAKLAESAPRPVVVRTSGASGDASALSTMLLAQILPQLGGTNGQVKPPAQSH